jgi:hypothetical protein
VSKRIPRIPYPLDVEYLISHRGKSGDTCKMIAERLGVLHKDSDKPKGRIIKLIAEELNLKPCGFIEKDIQRSSNGGYGYQPNEEPLFNLQQIQRIEQMLKACDVDINGEISKNGPFTFKGVVFRKR